MSTSTESYVLIVDDDPVTSRILSGKLQNLGFDCEHVTNDQAMMEAIAERMPDCILMDIMMPEVSGLDLLTKLRKTWGKLELPIIILTAQEENQSLKQAFKNGANDYIVKPPNFMVVEERLRTQIQLRDLHRVSRAKAESDVISAMVITYNHQINNPLAVLITRLQMIRRELEEGTKIHSNMTKAWESAERIKEIVEKIQDLQNKAPDFATYSENHKMVKI